MIYQVGQILASISFLKLRTDYRQSPININRPYKPLATGLKIRYKMPKGNLFFVNDGFKLILKGSFGKIFYGIHEYEAKEIHFHSPSEHTVIFIKNSLETMK